MTDTNTKVLNQHRPTPSTVSLSLLPVEIWRDIIRLAVLGSASTSLLTKSPFTDFHDADMKFTRATPVSQVCKAWNQMALECTFEYLLITLKGPLYELSLPASFIDPSGPLQHVRALRVSYEFTLTPLKIIYKPLISFLALCPNLSALDLSFPRSSPQLFQSILSACNSHLTSLHLHHVYFPGPLSQFFNNLSLPHLEHLRLVYIKHATLTCPDNVALSTLRTLVIEGNSPLNHTWTLPALTHLCFGQSFGFINASTLQRLSSNTTGSVKRLSFLQSVSSFPSLAASFPLVETLSLALPPQTSWIADSHFSFDYLREIDILAEPHADFFHDMGKFNQEARRAKIGGTLQKLGDAVLFPSVRRIRCVGFELPVRESWWDGFAHRLERRGVELEQRNPVALEF
jgi:hypothetical protein